ncbi:hypothetical protein [Streptomyces sp. NPDC057428]|uniref:hypothetical protein n=1 Tax=Streptomyces sp. NPDC057428 TaxID=3346129 RepID=UPI0036B60BF5
MAGMPAMFTESAPEVSGAQVITETGSLELPETPGREPHPDIISTPATADVRSL